MPRATEVFELPVQQMRAELGQPHEAAAELVRAGDYEDARSYMRGAETTEELIKDARALRE